MARRRSVGAPSIIDDSGCSVEEDRRHVYGESLSDSIRLHLPSICNTSHGSFSCGERFANFVPLPASAHPFLPPRGERALPVDSSFQNLSYSHG
jgi:hypothetical protein